MSNNLIEVTTQIQTSAAELMAQHAVNIGTTDHEDYAPDATVVMQFVKDAYSNLDTAKQKEADELGVMTILDIDPVETSNQITELYKKQDLSKFTPEQDDGVMEMDDADDDDTDGGEPSVDNNIEPIELTHTEMFPAVNSMLHTVTDGKVTDIASFIEAINDRNSEFNSLQAQIDAANAAVAAAKRESIPTSGAEEINGEELTYEVVYAKAADVFAFTDDKGKIKKAKPLAFDIPTLVWKNDKGEVVQHPEVPSVDEQYQLQPMQLLKFLTGFAQDSNTWLYGHTGTGKSTFVEQVAARVGFPVSRVNLDSFLERADFVGKVDLEGDGSGGTVTVYNEGILPRAMKRPGFLLLDEIDAGRPDILFVVQRVLEGNGLMLTEDHGRIVRSHPLFRFVATANTRGQGDEYGIYQGTRTLNNALIDRFPVFIEFDYLKKDAEMKLIAAKFPSIDSTMLEQMVTFAGEIRQAFKTGEVFQPITPRGLTNMASVFTHFNDIGIKKKGEALKMALEMTVYDKTTRDTVQRVRELADRCFKVKDAS
jgi:cobaltochelatase CobS